MDVDEPLLSVLRFSSLGADADVIYTCTCLHERFLAAGTSDGFVLLFELGGRLRRRWKAHRDRVLSIFADESGLFVGTVGADGLVVSWSVTSDDHFQQPAPHAPRTAAFAPDYARSASRRLCVGNASGNAFNISTSPSFGGERQVHFSVVGEGPIRCVAWCGPLVALATTARVYIKDVEANGTTRLRFCGTLRTTCVFSAFLPQLLSFVMNLRVGPLTRP